MTGLEIKGRLDRIGKTPLEHFKDIKELEVADGPEITVVDILPYKCEQVEKSLKAIEIIKEKLVDVSLIKKYDFVEDYNSAVWIAGRPKLVKEEFELLRSVLE